MSKLTRRTVLRGMVGGAAVNVALPLLNCMLNTNGTALADGKPMPVRFGTWGWGLGMNSSVFVPKKYGADFDLPEEISALEPIKKHINLITNTQAFRDNYQNLCHYTGWVIARTGSAPKDTKDIPGETIDVTIANQIGGGTRFKSLTATATGDVRNTYSYENSNTPNSPEWSPLQFYTRLFGPDFPDPNAKTFNPDPRIMVRRSVLSGVMDQTKSLMQTVPADDRARLDQYFTGLRHLEQQFQQRLEKPEPIEACVRPGEITVDPAMGQEAEAIAIRHKMMTELLVMALACDQTRVFNMAYTNANSSTIKPGYEKPHHTTTHEEPVDMHIGYQPTASWFTRRAMESWAYFVDAFTKVKEGNGTLLDNVFIMATTDHGYARVHSLDHIPVFTAGRCGGAVRTGLHIDGKGTTGCRVGYTALKLMGVDKPSWGVNSNNTSQEVGEILVSRMS
ncbi:DUF1552 domain-containing protein [Peristeroidobacter soli]|uniref:DUF1552 domain-containing protein n=1 Tax=Peristeroidobacter soli TaxID=2497877 RepID=UPI00101C1D9D|nr:DUF1552 domain-containing protein [Peristeroidobacter soli]